jgi:hypothetical protein
MTARAAVILSLFAVLVAAASPAVAVQLVTSAKIKDGTILKKDLSRSAVKALTGQRGEKGDAGLPGLPGARGAAGAPGRPGAQGLQGGQGPQGIQGLAGTAGGVDPAKVTYVNETQSVPGGTTLDIVAVCPAGSTVMGGGFTTTTNRIVGSVPVATGWKVTAVNPDMGSSDSGASAVCVTP